MSQFPFNFSSREVVEDDPADEEISFEMVSSATSQQSESTCIVNVPKLLPLPQPSSQLVRSSDLLLTTLQLGSPPADAFVTHYMNKGKYQSRFLLLPTGRFPSSAKGKDKLSALIKKSGGVVIECGSVWEDDLTVKEKHLIKIVDMDYLKQNINDVTLHNIQLPYDCFSSNFIWSQIYHRLIDPNGMLDADLNQYRISPTAYKMYNANSVLKGELSWNDIPHVPTHELPRTTSVKQIALEHFPELLFTPSSKNKVPRIRRTYSMQESQKLLDTICELNAHHRIHTITLYKELAAYYMDWRSYVSLREHFLKTILPHIMNDDENYSVAKEDARKFAEALEAFEKRPKRGRKRKIDTEVPSLVTKN